MGVYINMEMPKDCPMCPMSHWNVGGSFTGCDVVEGKRYAMDDEEYRNSSTRPDWCPLVPVPPHGRLIDADEFFKDICNSLNEMTAIGIAVDGEWMWGKLNDALENAPTVIEVEEDE